MGHQPSKSVDLAAVLGGDAAHTFDRAAVVSSAVLWRVITLGSARRRLRRAHPASRRRVGSCRAGTNRG